MTEVEELIKAAGEVLKKWRKPSNETEKDKPKKWQEMLDRPYGRFETKY